MKVIEMKQSVQLDTEKIVQYRKAKCWTQSRLAHVSGLGERSVQRIEAEGKASYQNALTLADALSVKLEDIMKIDLAAFEKSPLYDLIINKKAKFYRHVTSGNDLLRMIGGSHLFDLQEGHLQTKQEAETIGGFFQSVRDWGDIYNDVEPAGRIEAALGLTNELEEIDKLGFKVFSHISTMVSKIEGKPDLKFDCLSLLLMRNGAAEIITNTRGELLVAVVNENVDYRINF